MDEVIIEGRTVEVDQIKNWWSVDMMGNEDRCLHCGEKEDVTVIRLTPKECKRLIKALRHPYKERMGS